LTLLSGEKKIVWVTGAHGFIGRHLCRALAALGHTVFGLGHGAWPASEASVWGVSAWLNGDITISNLAEMQKSSGAPHAIFHLAGGSSVGSAIAQPREDFNRTVVSMAELLEWVRQYAPETRLIAVSSAAVYGAGHSGPIAESATLVPYSPYGYHKLMMEKLCSSYGASFGVASVIPRLFSVYGPGLKKQLIWDICGKLATGADDIVLGGTGQEIRDWVHVEDVVQAMIACADLAAYSSPVVNVGSGLALTVAEVANLVASAWARRGQGKPRISFSGQSRQGDPFSLLADPGLLKTFLPQFNCENQAGLEGYVDWYLSERKGNR
jgi:UDP-glucose 4-epimerase